MVRLIQLTDTTEVKISAPLVGGKTLASCVTTKFALGEKNDPHRPPTSTMEEYVPTRGGRISEVVFGEGEGIVITDDQTMEIMAQWYLENVYPELVKGLELPETDEGKWMGFNFWVFDDKHENIVLKNWKLTRIIDQWNRRVHLVGEKIYVRHETFEKATGIE